MEANRDAAQEFMTKGIEALRSGDKDKALRLLRKSNSLYPSKDIESLIHKLEAASSVPSSAPPPPPSSSSSSSSSTSSHSHSKPSAPRAEEPRPEPEAKKENYTEEQLALVKKVNKTKDYYEILGLSKDATESDVKSSYKKLALKLHPDKNKAPGSVEAFKAVKSAYDCLLDPEKRRHYDQFGVEEDSPPPPPHAHRGAYYATYGHPQEFTAEDLFNMFFGGVPPGAMPRRRTRYYQEHDYHGYQHHHQQQQQQQQQHRQQQGQPPPLLGSFVFLIPFLLILLMSFLNAPAHEEPFSLDKTGPYYIAMTTKSDVTYYVTSNFQRIYGRDHRAVFQVEAQADQQYIKRTQEACTREKAEQSRLLKEAKKHRGPDQPTLLKNAHNHPMPSCDKVNQFYAKAA
eukprot:TRINITY_DN6153_c0_g2_i1.p1 TRINITY_DN6153_c0_g2~~TRINITY_DN6153_c0_g2_i1.p1  ORF type:complete len:400 (+),score=63.90 TRINITY_DN6153_c0_g2_i1:62-1261(+)